MANNMESPPVCQIPDCTTTQAEIEAELATFLASYCSVCKKDRNGKLCGCAFPCSLTFKSQMMNKMHELLGLPKPQDRRALQVYNERIPKILSCFFYSNNSHRSNLHSGHQLNSCMQI